MQHEEAPSEEEDEDENNGDIDTTVAPKCLDLNVMGSHDEDDNVSKKKQNKIRKNGKNNHHHNVNDSPSSVVSQQLTDIVIDNTTYRTEDTFRNKSCLKKCCRGFRVQITAILSILDFWSNIIVILLFLYRAFIDNNFIFYIWSIIIGLFMIFTSILSWRMGPATSCNKLYYCCQIGIVFECQNSLNFDNDGHATYTFKLINFLEAISRCLPLSVLKLFILIWHNDDYHYYDNSTNYILIISIIFSILEYSFWFTNHIKDTLRDKFKQVFESIIPKANKYDGDYNQDPSQSIQKFKMDWKKKIMFTIFISFDLIARCGIFFVLFSYSRRTDHTFLIRALLPIILIFTEIITYLFPLYIISENYRNDLFKIYKKFQLLLMILISIISITPFYNDSTQTNINYKIKLFVLCFNMLFRLILMSTFMFILIYFTDFTLNTAQQYIFISFAIIQFILILYSTYIIYKCERLTWIAREKTKSVVEM